MSYRLMAVDDDEFIRLTIEELFGSEGIDVVTANGAEECVRELEKGFHGVILMDIMMPGNDGWDTIRMILEKDLIKDNIIVMLTAKDMPDNKIHGLEEYVTDYVTKPFEGEELVASVKEYFTYLDSQKEGI